MPKPGKFLVRSVSSVYTSFSWNRRSICNRPLCWSSKPAGKSIFKKKLVEDLIAVKIHGFDYMGVNVKVHTEGLICDTSARSFVLYTLSHNAYFGCRRCIIERIYIDRMVYLELNCPERTDASLRQKSNEQNHKGMCIFSEYNRTTFLHILIRTFNYRFIRLY